MGEITNIEWTDHTFNCWIGCTEVSPACDHCYAASLDKRWGHASWGKGAPRRVTSDAYWKQPLKWDRAAAEAGEKKKVFCASMADVMDDEAPKGVRERLWELIDATPNLIWQLLTKRPQRYERYLPKQFKNNNVWYGTTTENQEMYDLRFGFAMEASINRGGVCFISYEPALGPLNIRKSPRTGFYYNVPPDWIIVGGESGHHSRPMHSQWVFDLHSQCQVENIPLFLKQWGEWASPACEAFGKIKGEVRWIRSDGSFWDEPPQDENADALTVVRVGKKAAGSKFIGGEECKQFPEAR